MQDSPKLRTNTKIARASLYVLHQFREYPEGTEFHFHNGWGFASVRPAGAYGARNADPFKKLGEVRCHQPEIDWLAKNGLLETVDPPRAYLNVWRVSEKGRQV